MLRERHRLMTNVYKTGKRSYDGASVSRRTAGWFAPGTSANSEISSALTKLRDRSRDLVRNNMYAHRAIKAIARNTVGKGIMPSPEVSGNDKLDDIIKKEWRAWAKKPKLVDFQGNKSFYGIQKLVVKTLGESGEVLVLRRRVKGQRIPFQLQVLEPDYIDISKNYENQDGSRVAQGIDLDSNGIVRGYWLFQQHPGEAVNYGSFNSKFIPKSEVLHIFQEDRPGQLRGIPFGVSCFIKLRDFDEYDDAQLIRQKIAACFAAFITDNGTDTVVGSGTSDDDDDGLEKLEPGIIEHLAPGKEVSFGTPPVVEGYREYTSVSLHAVAAGYEVPYELLTTDLSEVNYSSIRMGWLEFQRFIDDIQDDILVPKLLDPVWEWFIEALMMRGVVKQDADVPVNWTPPRREMINPKEDIKADVDEIRAGLSSYSEKVRKRGRDPEELIKEIDKDFKKFEELELMLTCDPRFDPSRKDEEGDGDPKNDDGSSGKKVIKKK